ncbi:hypothetical protein HID58_089124 [Brassica napus]|uniref:Major facilitator superfamily (MFS) profile domain-containing protein n=1 Tax=Brassica napus TaxID=3708 RepID=A0ABQ7Y0M0_BRANA|nr:hypothetical protein HID58_089124 [Brassica napus]
MAKEYNEALLEKHYHEGCPGCKVEKMKEVRRGYPYLELSFIWIIEDFGVAKTEKDIGYYAGFIACAFMFGRALTSIFWGIMADRYGRKPIILLGTITIAVFNALFGMSTNIWMAIATRFMLGSFNCLAYASEICREEYQATAMSAVSTAWGIGLIIGPVLGGFLAQPADKYPSVFSKESIFGRFRYALPCFTISAFALVVTALCCFIPETLHNHELDNKTSDDDSVEALEAASLETTGMPGNNKRASLFKNWPLMSSILVYCVLCLHDTVYSEIFALWANSPCKYGGLGYSTNQVGTVLTISGMSYHFTALLHVLLYPSADRLLGPVQLARLAGALMIPVQLSYPFIAQLSGVTQSLLLSSASILVNVFSISAITGMVILQNRAVDQHQRGAANGLAMTSMSLFKTVGPVGAGILFSWTEGRKDAPFLPGPHMLFFFLNLMVIVGVSLTFKPFLVTARR